MADPIIVKAVLIDGKWYVTDKEGNPVQVSPYYIKIDKENPNIGVYDSSKNITAATLTAGVWYITNEKGKRIPVSPYYITVDKENPNKGIYSSGQAQTTSNLSGEYTGGYIIGEDGKKYRAIYNDSGAVVPSTELAEENEQITSTEENEIDTLLSSLGIPSTNTTIGTTYTNAMYKSPEEIPAQYRNENYEIKTSMDSNGSPFWYVLPVNAAAGRNSLQEQVSLYDQTTGKNNAANLALQQRQQDFAEKAQLAQLQSNPANWIEAWYLNRKLENAGKSPVITSVSEMPGVQATSDALKQAETTYVNALDSAGGDETAPGVQEATRILNFRLADSEKAKGEAINTLREESSHPGDAWNPINPSTPEWLKEYAPGVGKYNQDRPEKYNEITRVEVPTFSAQQFANMSPTKQSGLSSYLNWASTYKDKYGQTKGNLSFQDMVANMKRTLPKNPSGAGTESWAAARQYRV